MKISNSQFFAVMAVLGLGANTSVAAESALNSEEVSAQLRSMIESGLVTFDPETNKPIIHVNVLEEMKREGRVGVAAAKDGEICGTRGGP